MESTVDNLVCALCLDYDRRSEALVEKNCSKRVATELRYYNAMIWQAAVEVSGLRDAGIFISDIGKRDGYAATDASYYSEQTYKNYKKMIKENIARKLHLCD